MAEQPLPKGRGHVIVPLVVDDLWARMRVGTERYGEPLTADNGRNALRDAYEEALDLCCYLKQEMVEREARRANRSTRELLEQKLIDDGYISQEALEQQKLRLAEELTMAVHRMEERDAPARSVSVDGERPKEVSSVHGPHGERGNGGRIYFSNPSTDPDVFPEQA